MPTANLFFAITLALAFMLPVHSLAAENVVILSCHDGDTCLGQRSDGRRMKIRLSGVDAPEVGFDFSDEAVRYLESLVLNRAVELECDGASFSRVTCFITVAGMDINSEMVRAGYAWDFPRHSGGRYKQLEKEARIAKRGLWQGRNIRSPFCQRLVTPYSKNRCAENQQYQD